MNQLPQNKSHPLAPDKVLAALPVYVCVLERSGQIASINRVGPDEEMADVVGRLAYADLDPTYHDFYKEQVEFVFRERRHIQFVCQDQRREHWYSVILSPLPENPDQITCVATEITAQREMEESLKADSARVKRVLSRVPAMIWTTDAELRLLSMEGAVLANQTDTANLLGRSIAEIVPIAAGAEKLLILSNQALRGKSGKYDHLWDDKYFEVSVEPLTNPGGEITGTLGVGIDVTRQWRQAQELEQAKLQLQQEFANTSKQLHQVSDRLEQRDRWLANLVHAFPTGAGIARIADGKILAINEAGAAAIGRRVTEAIGESVASVYANPEQRSQIIARANTESASQRELVKVIRGDGSLGWVAIHVHKMEFDGEPCFFTILRDVTEEEETRRELISDRSRLAELVLSQEQERKLLAYEIHDGMAQDLAGAKMFLEVYLHSNPPADPQGNLTRAFRLLGKSIDEARRLINGLRPPVLEHEGLLIALENLISEFATDRKLEVELQVENPISPLPSALEMAVYRIIQECLTNAAKHGDVNAARVTIEETAGIVSLTIKDQGAGFDVNTRKDESFGLRGIKERARLLGGEVQIKSQPGKGTTVGVQFPVSQAAS